MNPLTDEELIAKCDDILNKMASQHKEMPEYIKILGHAITRFKKLTQPEQVSGDLTERIFDSVKYIVHDYNCTLDKSSDEVADDEPIECTCGKWDDLRTAIQTALSGKIDKR